MVVRHFVQELWGGWTKASHTCHSWGFVCFDATCLLNMVMFGVFIWEAGGCG